MLRSAGEMGAGVCQVGGIRCVHSYKAPSCLSAVRPCSPPAAIPVENIIARHSLFGRATRNNTTISLCRAACGGATRGPHWRGKPAVRHGGADGGRGRKGWRGPKSLALSRQPTCRDKAVAPAHVARQAQPRQCLRGGALPRPVSVSILSRHMQWRDRG